MQRVCPQCELQGGLGLREAPFGPGPVAEPDENLPMQSMQLVPRTSGPGLVAIAGQQLALVRRLGRPQFGEVAAVQRGFRLRTEPRRIDVDEPAGPEDDHLVPKLQQAVGSLARECSPGCVQGLVQVVGGRRWREIRPEQVEQVLAVQPLGGIQRKQLDHRLRLGQPPPRCVDRTTADLDAEPSEQLHTHVVAPARSIAPTPQPVVGHAPSCGTSAAGRRRGQSGTTTVTCWTTLLANPPRFHGCSTGWLRPLSSCARAES